MDKQHLTNGEHLAKLILDMGIPANDASTALLPQKLTVSGMSRTVLADALGDLVPKITKSTAIADIESHRKAAELILERPGMRSSTVNTIFGVQCFCYHWTSPLQDTIEPY